MKNIPYGRQYIDNADIQSVKNSLKQDLITTGLYVRKFEDRICNLFKSKYSLSCSSGTSGLHLAMLSINLNRNDVVIMPAINFIASYSIAKNMNAKIYLADVDPVSGQMTPKTLNDCIKNNRIKKIKAIITMPMGGFPENLEEFYKVKSSFKCYLIEDACHAMGAKYMTKKKSFYVGSCRHSDLCVFSLHPVKSITSGEGGVVTTNKKELYEKMISLRSHGIVRNKSAHWKYDISQLGYNYRLSDINCALALSQLKKISKFIDYRKRVYQNYIEGFKHYQNIFKFYDYKKNNKSSFHLLLLSINFKKTKTTKQKFLSFMKKNKINCQYHYIPIYKFDIFKEKIIKKNFKGSEYYYQHTLSLPVFYKLNLSTQQKILSKIIMFFKLK